MKILGVSFSLRKGGNSETLLAEALKGAAQCGAETELYSLRNKDIGPCRGCMSCKEAGVCALKDDMQEIYPRLEEAQGIILASPVYYYSISGLARPSWTGPTPLNPLSRGL